MVLGAGGAAKAAVLALMKEGASVTVANRTRFKAEKAAQELGCGLCDIEELEGALADASVLVSALSTNERVVAPEALRKGLAVLDANYSATTSRAHDATDAGCRVMDGREWLVDEGAKAFSIFSGKEAPLREMRKALFETGSRKRETGNIALIGMMGSGKSTIAKELGGRTGTGVIDVDGRAEGRAGKEIRRIFSEDGEDAFRKLEGEELSRALGEGGIINCGGGAILDAHNREALRNLAVSVWLWADARTLASRIMADGKRPLMDGPEPEKRLGEILAGRLGRYAEASDIVLDTGRISPPQAAERILYEIH